MLFIIWDVPTSSLIITKGWILMLVLNGIYGRNACQSLKSDKANSGFFLQQEETSVSLFTSMIQCIQYMVTGSNWNEKVC